MSSNFLIIYFNKMFVNRARGAQRNRLKLSDSLRKVSEELKTLHSPSKDYLSVFASAQDDSSERTGENIHSSARLRP